MMKKNNIICKDITKTYKLYQHNSDMIKEALNPFRRKYHTEFNALKNINFEVNNGEMLGIVGRNGAGKSTLLSIICSIIYPTKGSCYVNGKIAALIGATLGDNFSTTRSSSSS